MNRKLTSNELRLLVVFGALLLAFANIWFWTTFSSKRTEILAEWEALQSRKLETDIWLRERELWETRLSWMEENQPYRPSASEASSSLLAFLQSTAAERSITTPQQNLGNPVLRESEVEVVAELRGEAPLEALIAWCHQISSPSDFRWVRQITLKKAPTGDKMQFTIIAAQLFRIGPVASLGTAPITTESPTTSTISPTPAESELPTDIEHPPAPKTQPTIETE